MKSLFLIFVCFTNILSCDKFESYLFDMTEKKLDSHIRNSIPNSGIYKIDMDLRSKGNSDLKAKIDFHLDLDNRNITHYSSHSYTEDNPNVKIFELYQINIRNYFYPYWPRGYSKTIWDGRFKELVYIFYSNTEGYYSIYLNINTDVWDSSGSLNGEGYSYTNYTIYIQTDVLTAKNYSFFEKIMFLIKDEKIDARDVFNSNSSCVLELNSYEKKSDDNKFKLFAPTQIWTGEISISKTN